MLNYDSECSLLLGWAARLWDPTCWLLEASHSSSYLRPHTQAAFLKVQRRKKESNDLKREGVGGGRKPRFKKDE